MNKILTGDQNLVKKINKSLVLNCIEQIGPVSRAEVSKETGLNKATVSTMVRELIQDQFVNEIGMGKSSGGRKPVMLYFNYHAGYSIGIDLGVYHILAILTDLKGTIVEEISEPLNGTEQKTIIAQILNIINKLIQNAPKSPYGIIGIGIGVPGSVNKEGEVLFTPNLNLNQINLKKTLEDQFNIPTVVINEANAGVRGEQKYGTGKNIDHLIYVSIGTGIGTGIIINNKLYTGSIGISGEIGHHTIETSEKKCRCGNYGCWELYASENALLLQAKKLPVFEYTNNIHLNMIEIEANKENPEVLQLLENIGKYIGIGLVNIINTFNPKMVILGNRMSRFEKWISKSINETVNERLSRFHRDSVKIRFASLGKYSSSLGASSFVITKFLEDNQVSINIE